AARGRAPASPTGRSSDLVRPKAQPAARWLIACASARASGDASSPAAAPIVTQAPASLRQLWTTIAMPERVLTTYSSSGAPFATRSEEHTSELQSRENLV